MSLFNNAKLILTPNGYKDGKLYTFKPFDGSKDFDVIRATKATRVNSNGLIEEVDNNIIRLDYTENSCPCILVEEQRTNLLLHSEDFNDAVWTKFGSTVNSDVVISPDGSTNADALVEDFTSNTKAVRQNDVGLVNQEYQFSCFVKKGSRNRLRFYVGMISNWDVIPNGFFDLDDKSVFLGNGTIEEYDNNWFRISVFGKFGSSSGIIQYFIASIMGTSQTYTGDGSEALYIWGAQLEQGTKPSSYIPTTTSTVTRNADIATVTPPVGVTQIIETFEDNSTNIITSIPSTYQLPVGRIKHIVML